MRGAVGGRDRGVAVPGRRRGTWRCSACGSGPDPRACVTTTPKPIRLIRDLVRDEHWSSRTAPPTTTSRNLAPAFATAIIRRYEGTRLGRQELDAELLEDEGLAYRFSEHAHVIHGAWEPPAIVRAVRELRLRQQQPDLLARVVRRLRRQPGHLRRVLRAGAASRRSRRRSSLGASGGARQRLLGRPVTVDRQGRHEQVRPGGELGGRVPRVGRLDREGEQRPQAPATSA